MDDATCSIMFIYPFRTFDEHSTWTALLLLTKAKVQKIPCDLLSVNMAARQMFGARDLVWPVTNVVLSDRISVLSLIEVVS